MFLKKFLKIKLYIFISVILACITIVNILGVFLFLPNKLQEDKVVLIEHNLSIREISQILESKDIILNAKFFEIIGSLYSYHASLKSGEYKFTAFMTPHQVLRTLERGKSILHRLFIPEGLMVSEILYKINNEQRLSGRIIDHIPEGYLMPSTYYYSYGDTRQKIINQMRDKMSESLNKVMLLLPKDSPLKTRLDVLTLASIIEKEAGHDNERNKVASVFINRLNIGMKLQADPTTAYAVTQGKYKLKRALTRKDLRIKSEYNTYYAKGLPPGPIACPGHKSLLSTVSNVKTKALYFVVNGKGGHHFSNSLKEHNMHVRQFRINSKKNSKK